MQDAGDGVGVGDDLEDTHAAAASSAAGDVEREDAGEELGPCGEVWRRTRRRPASRHPRRGPGRAAGRRRGRRTGGGCGGGGDGGWRGRRSTGSCGSREPRPESRRRNVRNWVVWYRRGTMRKHLEQDRWRRQSWLRRVILTSPLAALVGWVACDPGDGCCNTCGRNYYVGRTDAAQVWIENIQEGSNECEIDDLPREVPGGVSTFVAVVSAFDGVGSRASDRIVVEAHATGDVSS